VEIILQQPSRCGIRNENLGTESAWRATLESVLDSRQFVQNLSLSRPTSPFLDRALTSSGQSEFSSSTAMTLPFTPTCRQNS
jgi:hypothetical protein